MKRRRSSSSADENEIRKKLEENVNKDDKPTEKSSEMRQADKSEKKDSSDSTPKKKKPKIGPASKVKRKRSSSGGGENDEHSKKAKKEESDAKDNEKADKGMFIEVCLYKGWQSAKKIDGYGFRIFFSGFLASRIQIPIFSQHRYLNFKIGKILLEWQIQQISSNDKHLHEYFGIFNS